MKSKHLYVFAIVAAMVAMMLPSCGGADVKKLQAERDSLIFLTMDQGQSLSDYKSLVDIINTTLDSIDYQEANLYVGQGELPATRDEVINNLSRFEDMVKRQQQKIEELEKMLKESNRKNNEVMTLIAHFKQQIAEKDAEIATLRQQVEDQKVSIQNLTGRVQSQQATIDEQNSQIETLSQQTETMNSMIEHQDAMINKAYVFIGSKDDLKHAGIVKKGKLVLDGTLDRSKFIQVDVRTWTTYEFDGKKPKVLTSMPANSYTLKEVSKRHYVLTITNPTAFWSISNYLVIQTN